MALVPRDRSGMPWKRYNPSSTLSTTEAISVVNSGLALAAHLGDGRLGAADVASGLIGAAVKNLVQDQMIWKEYLETVVKSDRIGKTCIALAEKSGAKKVRR